MPISIASQNPEQEEGVEVKQGKVKRFMGSCIENKLSNIFFIVLTLVALYMDDIRQGFTNKEADVFIDTVMLV